MGTRLKKTAIYAILQKVKAGEITVDHRHLNPKKITWVPDVITSVAAAVEEDQRVTIKKHFFFCQWGLC
jgi:hypothetical protein